MAQVFISYSRKDKDFVRRLNDALVAKQREAWVDWRDIPPKAEWLEEIFQNIEAADNFLFVISPESVASNVARKEIDHAAIGNKPIVPVYYRAVPDDDLPEAVAKIQRIDFSGDAGFEASFAKLIDALDTDLDWKAAHKRLLTRAREWEATGKDSSFLLRGKDLREAEQWVAKSAEKEPKPSTLQSQYIMASRQSATRWQRIVIAAVAAAFLIAVGLAGYALANAKEANRRLQEVRRQNGILLGQRLASDARYLLASAGDTSLAARLALEAVARTQSPETMGALYDVDAVFPRIAGTGHPSPLFDPDGGITYYGERTYAIHAKLDHTCAYALAVPAKLGCVDYYHSAMRLAPDGRVLWSAPTRDEIGGSFRAWELASGGARPRPAPRFGPGQNAIYTDDLKWVAAAKGTTVTIYSTDAGRMVKTADLRALLPSRV